MYATEFVLHYIHYLNFIPLLARKTAAPSRAPSANFAIGTLSKARKAAIISPPLSSVLGLYYKLGYTKHRECCNKP